MIDARAWILWRRRAEEASEAALPVGRRRSRVRAARPANLLRVTIVGGLGVALAVLLTSGSMLERALQQPFGGERDQQVAVWERIEEVSERLYLDQPGRWVNDALNRNEAASEDPLLNLQPQPTARPAASDANAPVVLFPAATPTPEASAIRQPSRAEPLRMWVAGDSMAGIFGLALVRMANDTGLVSADVDYRLATGLSRPDYFNWPAHLQKQTAKRRPEVIVVVFGANDSQGLRTPAGDVYQPLSDGWRLEYARRVGGTMDLLNAPGRIVIWIGQPVARDSDFSKRMTDLNRIYATQAASRPWVRFVDTFPVFADRNGAYNAYLPGQGGDMERVREEDGIHLTWAGGEKLAAVVLGSLEEFVDLKPAAPASKPAR